jgi:hypothetical protein
MTWLLAWIGTNLWEVRHVPAIVAGISAGGLALMTATIGMTALWRALRRRARRKGTTSNSGHCS